MIRFIYIIVFFYFTYSKYMVKVQQKRNSNPKSNGTSKKKPPTKKIITKASNLSQRGIIAKTPPRDDFDQIMQAMMDPYHPTKNKKGYLGLILAENKLSHPELKDKIFEVQKKYPMPDWATGYIDMNGHQTFRKAIANMLEKTWVKAKVDPNCLAVQTGCGAILDSLGWSLCNEGDTCMTPAPIYPAFPNDFRARSKLNFVIFDTDASNLYEPTVSELEKCYRQCTKKGSKPKILLLCNPCNPTGVIYSKKTLNMCVDWSQQKGMHLISDEIYGNSIFPNQKIDSIAKVMQDKNKGKERYMGDNVHMCSGFSKDFTLNGFRCGYLFTHNQDLLQALGSIGYFQTVSTLTQHILTKVLEDEKWTFNWINNNRQRLKKCFDGLQDAMNAVDVPLTPCQGTMMAWADFSKYLKTNDSAGEKELWLDLCNNDKVIFTTGASCFSTKPGFFRVCFAYPQTDEKDYQIAMKELKKRLIKKFKN